MAKNKRRYELSPQVRARANNFQVCKQYILQGLGIGAMPTQIICTDELRDGSIVPVLPEWKPEPLDVHMIYPFELSFSTLISAFYEAALRDHRREHRPQLTDYARLHPRRESASEGLLECSFGATGGWARTMKSQTLCRSSPSGSRHVARKAWVAIWKSISGGRAKVQIPLGMLVGADSSLMLKDPATWR